VAQGFIPGGLNNNRDFISCLVECAADVPEGLHTLAYDPQTAGGLLASVDATDAVAALAELRAAGVDWARLSPRASPAFCSFRNRNQFLKS
jgi:selenide,water dikinase